MRAGALIEPKDAEYPQVPTPKELELSRQLVELQHEKDFRENRSLAQIRDLESQVHKLQVRVHDLSQMLQSTKRDQILAQQVAVEDERKHWKVTVGALKADLDQERNDREAQKSWQTRFILPLEASVDNFLSSDPSKASTIDPKKNVFARFAQSLALLPASVAPKVAEAGALSFLVHLLQQKMGDVVTGSVLIALVHLAIHKVNSRSSKILPAIVGDIREQIIKAGVGAPLVDILENSPNPRILVEASRLCAALASYIPNKRVLASKNVVRFCIQHLMPRIPPRNREKRDDDDDEDISITLEKLPFPWDTAVQQNMLSALVNLSCESEILRSQIAATPFFLPIVIRYVRESTSVGVQAEAAKLLGNMAFNHVVNQSALMAADAPTALTACLTAANLQRNPQLVRAGAVGLANLAYTSVNQLTIGYSNASTMLLQLLVDSISQVSVIEAASTALACLCHQNPPNKARVVAQNGLQVLLYTLSAIPDTEEDESEQAAALIALCECFAVLANSRPNRQQVMELDGHFLLCQLCQRCSANTSPKLLEASARAICALVPPPRERNALIADNHESKMETKSVALKTLERAHHLLKQESQRHNGEDEVTIKGRRRWLTETIDILTKYQVLAISRPSAAIPETLKNAETEVDPSLMEFRERSSFSLESLTVIPPDDLCPHFYDD